jgi:hypothetical protein
MESYRRGETFRFRFPVYEAGAKTSPSSTTSRVIKNGEVLVGASASYASLGTGLVGGSYLIPTYQPDDNLFVETTFEVNGWQQVKYHRVPLYRRFYPTDSTFAVAFPVYDQGLLVPIDDIDITFRVLVNNSAVAAEGAWSSLGEGKIWLEVEVPSYNDGDTVTLEVTVEIPSGVRTDYFEIPAYRSESVSIGAGTPTSGDLLGNWVIFQNEEAFKVWQIVDDAGDPVNVEGHDFQLVVHGKDDDEVLVSVVADLTESDSDGNPGVFDRVAATIPEDDTAGMLGVQHSYKLWDLTDKKVYGSGDLIVYRAPLPA